MDYGEIEVQSTEIIIFIRDFLQALQCKKKAAGGVSPLRQLFYEGFLVRKRSK
jgi:hypothetical protein